jgi:hypothetical protein
MSDTGELKKLLWKKMQDGPFVMVGLEGGGHCQRRRKNLPRGGAKVCQLATPARNVGRA